MPIPLGALRHDNGFLFRVWAPQASQVDLVLEPSGDSVGMQAVGDGYFEYYAPDAEPGQLYRYRLDGGDPFPDPASRYQPNGVHGPSMVVDPTAYPWQRPAPEIAQRDLVFYELHVGTFTTEGTLRAATDKLPYLHDLGITAAELMPLADFPGRWNWGYDHAALYAPSQAYGTPDDLRTFVDTAHGLGLVVFLDVIYNHLGPDGAYVAAFAPMFTDKHHTPWGQAMNLDDTHSEGVRNFFIDNALHWLREYRLDGLRLDAVHALKDDSEPHFLAELAETVAALDGPRRTLIAEDHRNLNRLVRPPSEGGYGLDGVWADDFHHLVRNILAGDDEGYYEDYADSTASDLAAAIRQGWFYTGQYSPHWGEARGTPPDGVRPDQCVVCIQNHDQIGNRPQGTRLTDDIGPAAYRAASALLLFVPELPLLFMGQEWAASAPFLFFTDHNDELGRQVTAGRKREFEQFAGFQGTVPDPQAASTFTQSRLDWNELNQDRHARTRRLYRDLLHLRPHFDDLDGAEAHDPRGLVVRRGSHHLLVALAGDMTLPLPDGFDLVMHTEESVYAGPEGKAPVAGDGHLYFAVAGAALLRRHD